MEASQTDRRFWFLCLVAGQLIETVSTFFWLDSGRHTINGSVLVILGMVFWMVGFIGLFDFFKEKNPWYSRIGLLYAFYGCLGGIAFGFEGFYSEAIGENKIGVDIFSKFPLQTNLVLFWAGPAFPLSLLILGIMMIVRKMQPIWISILIIIGAVAFPVSRISRTEWVAHMADVILLLPLCLVYIRSYRKEI
jgi:hypothetical protein